jgi:AcrR family transcriptional regulator
MPKPVKTITKSEETRSRILRSALELFHDRGFETTTMRDIAAKSGVATGAAYYYFESKDAIVLAFYDEARKVMTPRLKEVLAQSQDLRQRVEGLIQVKLEYFETSRQLLRALSGRTNPEHPLSPFSRQTREIREGDIQFFREALQESRSPGPEDLKEYLPLLLWMYQMGILLFWLFDSSKKQSKTQALLNQSLDVVVRLIQLASLPLTKPVRRKVIQLVDIVMA